MGFDDRALAFDFADTFAQIGGEFCEGSHLCFGGLVAVEVTDQADTEGDVVEIVAGNVTSVYLVGPTVANFDLAIPGFAPIPDYKVVGHTIFHFSDTFMVIVEDFCIPLACAAVVDDYVLPASATHLGLVDCPAYGFGQVAET